MQSQSAARPEARQLSVEELMHDVRAGKLRVPGFQRLYRWDPADVCDLFDSIYRGYPVGTLLFWEREANAELIKLSGVSIDAPKVANAWWVVDGQQRITSLANALLSDEGGAIGSAGTEKKRRRYYAFNLETENFVYTARGEDGPPLLPLAHVLDSKSVLTWLSKNGVSTDSKSFERALEVNKLVRESRLNAYILRNADEQYVRTVFDRINNFGKRLDDAEVFNSLHGGLTESRPNDLRQLSESLLRIGFGQLPEKLVLQCLIAARGGDPTRMKAELRATRNAEAFEATERALAQALNFLKRDAEIPHFALLPYAVVPMMTLARFFNVFPEPKARTRELLRRWIYRGAISEAPSGNAAPKIRHALK
ncbi:MAG: DUF262 domain-containing protein, partial [Myxococcales bacterium]|nr:DUF262 domain-containing protein [Myxococcales bacterium]